MLSDSEARALEAILNEAIIDSQDDDGDPVFHDVNVKAVNPFGDRRTQSEVFTSLSKKRLIECSGMEDLSGTKSLSSSALRRKGWKH